MQDLGSRASIRTSGLEDASWSASRTASSVKTSVPGKALAAITNGSPRSSK